jgi:quinol monooxygenase YgiN/catechol 2,3-dioxygenase-like lactoylglutathione lyase family enzyme
VVVGTRRSCLTYENEEIRRNNHLTTEGGYDMRKLAVLGTSLIWANVAVIAALLAVSRRVSAQSLSGSEVAAISNITPLPGHEAEVRNAILAVRTQTLLDPGCLYFFLNTSADAPGTFVLYEVFRSQAAFDRHREAAATRRFVEELKGRVPGDQPVVTILHSSPGAVSAKKAEQTTSPDPATPRGIDHVGLTVPDVNAAADFLERAFDARPIYDVLPEGDKPMAGHETEVELGLPSGAEIVHMRLMRIGNGPTLELFQLRNTPQQRVAGLNDFGWTHVALYVDDIQKVSARFEAAGGQLLSPPHTLAGVEAGPKNRGVYGRAPWGGLIELVSYPSGIKYPNPQIARWTPQR